MAYLLLAVVYLSFVGLGFPVALLGSAWPTMHMEFLLSLAFSGYINIMISGGNICASVFVERIVKKIGTGRLVAISTAMICMAMFGFSYSTRSWHLILFAAIYGLGAGGIDVSINNYLALNLSYKHLSWSHGIWGISAISSPFIMSWALMHKTWRFGYLVVGFIMLFLSLIILATLPVWKIEAKGTDIDKQPVVGLKKALRIHGIGFRLISVSAYSAISVLCQLWPSSYMVYAKSFSQERAAAFASLFFMGMTLGRFGFGMITDRLNHRKVINIGTMIILVGVACICAPSEFQVLIILGFLLMGIGCSQIFPSFIRSTKEYYGTEMSQALVGLQFGTASLSALVAPSVVGMMINHMGMRPLPFILIILVAIMFLFSKGPAVKNLTN